MTDDRTEDDTDVDVFEAVARQVDDEVDNGFTDLPPAGLLTVERADALLRWRRAKVVTVVGERFGGKTTLVAETYERFLRGPFAGYLFCHSLSLLGFEQKSFWSRAVSNAKHPDTQRTSANDGLKFFHLAACPADGSYRTDLLISERAGETYRGARDAPSTAQQLVEFSKADIIVLILDGARVADGRERAETFASARTLAQVLRDSGATRPGAVVQLVTTKEDLLDGDERAAARDALTKFEEKFVTTFSPAFGEVTTLRIAARDPTGRVPAATGLDALLHSWLLPLPPVTPAARPQPDLADEFDRLLIRRTG